MQSSPQRTFGDSELACFVRIESAFAFLLNDREAEGHRTAMVDSERADGVARAVDLLTVVNLEDRDRKRGALEAESLHAFEHPGGPLGSPESERFGAALQGHRPNQA